MRYNSFPLRIDHGPFGGDADLRHGDRNGLLYGRRPADAHHLRFAQSRTLGRKVSDEFTVPLRRGHHREIHRCGDEAAWWKKVGIDPTVSARALWLESHPLPTASGDDRSIGERPNDKTKSVFDVGAP